MKPTENPDPRPVKCLLCNQKMFYKGHTNWVPEYTLDVSDSWNEYGYYKRDYIHKTCWEKLQTIRKERT